MWCRWWTRWRFWRCQRLPGMQRKASSVIKALICDIFMTAINRDMEINWTFASMRRGPLIGHVIDNGRAGRRTGDERCSAVEKYRGKWTISLSMETQQQHGVQKQKQPCRGVQLLNGGPFPLIHWLSLVSINQDPQTGTSRTVRGISFVMRRGRVTHTRCETNR